MITRRLYVFNHQRELKEFIIKKSGMDKPIIHKLVLFIAAVCSTVSVSAYDFEVDGIYYNKISDTSVEVTHDGSLDDNNGAGYSGNVTIPETGKIYIIVVDGFATKVIAK